LDVWLPLPVVYWTKKWHTAYSCYTV